MLFLAGLVGCMCNEFQLIIGCYMLYLLAVLLMVNCGFGIPLSIKQCHQHGDHFYLFRALSCLRRI